MPQQGESMTTGYDDSLEVVALSDHEWRVCDRDMEAGDGRRILAYIEKRDGSYEVMSMKPTPCVCGRFCSFDDALKKVGAERRKTNAMGAGFEEGARS
jgi:hypothetical protein